MDQDPITPGIADQVDQEHQADYSSEPPITLAATSMLITEIFARDTANASQIDATRTAQNRERGRASVFHPIRWMEPAPPGGGVVPDGE